MEKLVIPSGPGYRSATRFVDVIGRVESGGTGDFVLDLAAPLPLKIIGDLIGVPECRSAGVPESESVRTSTSR